MKTLRRLMLVGISLALVSACGGGGSGLQTSKEPPPLNPRAQGLWKGTTSTGRAIAGLVLDDGRYWFIYSAAGNNAVLGGAVQGHGAGAGNDFISSDGIDFNFEGQGINSFTLSGTVAEKSTFGATVSFTNSQFTISANYDADYETPPSLAAIAGSYVGTAVTAAGYDATSLTVSGTGDITGSSAGGCSFTGTATPRTTGNAYDVSVVFAGGTCSNGTNTVQGAAYFDSKTQELRSAALNTDNTNGFYFGGVKQ